jgi:hypothetical protein
MDPNNDTKPGDAAPDAAAAAASAATDTPATDTPDPKAAAPGADAPAGDKPADDKNKPAPSLQDALREGLKNSAPASETTDKPADTKVDEPAKPPEKKTTETPVKPDAAALAAEDAKLMAEAKPRTKERFQQLITRTEELETKVKEYEPVIAENKQWREIVNATGATPEELVQNFEYLALVSTSTPESLEKALGMLDQQREMIAIKLGRPVNGVDFLKGHKDLQDLVEAGEMDPAKAQELALLRRDKQQRSDAANRSTQTEEQREQALAQGKREVDAVDASFKGVDPQYAEKIKLLAPKFAEIARTKPPTEWADAFRTEYLAVKLSAAPATPAARTPVTPSTRSSVSTSNNKAEPTTMEQALRQGLNIGAAT